MKNGDESLATQNNKQSHNTILSAVREEIGKEDSKWQETQFR